MRTLSAEDNMVLFAFKLRALRGPAPDVRMMAVDESISRQVQEVRGAVTQVERKLDDHLLNKEEDKTQEILLLLE